VSRFGRELVDFNIKTIGYRNAELPTLGIAIANTLNCMLGTGEEYSQDNEENIAEEIHFGMTFSSVSVTYETDNRRYIHKDFLNREECVKAVIGDDTDGVILVINAEEGITSDIREQVEFVRQAGVNYLSVFADNCHLIEDYDELENLGSEICELLDMYGYCGEDTPVVYGSLKEALDDPEGEWGEKLLELMENMDYAVPDPEKDTDKPFLMPVEDVFVITGRGIVATGRVETGVIKLNDRVELVGFGSSNRTVTVTGIEMFRKLMDSAEPGDNIGLLLRGVEKAEVKRGHVITRFGAHKEYNKFTAVVYFSDTEFMKQLAAGVKTDFQMRTVLIAGEISASADKINCSGKYAQVTVELTESVAMNNGMFFAVRNVGIGRITEVL